MASTPPDPPPVPSGWLAAVKGLTISNAVVIVLLVVALGPAYVAWRMLNDPDLLDRFMSSYHVYDVQPTSCTLRRARQRGEAYTWALNSGFAFDGGARWSIGVVLMHEPTEEEQRSYCETLHLIVDWMRRGGGGSPPSVVWQYRNGLLSH